MQLTPERMADLLREAGFGAIVNHRTSRTTLLDDLIVIAPNTGEAKIRSIHYYGVRMLFAGEREEDLKAAIRNTLGRKKATESVQQFLPQNQHGAHHAPYHTHRRTLHVPRKSL